MGIAFFLTQSSIGCESLACQTRSKTGFRVVMSRAMLRCMTERQRVNEVGYSSAYRSSNHGSFRKYLNFTLENRISLF